MNRLFELNELIELANTYLNQLAVDQTARDLKQGDCVQVVYISGCPCVDLLGNECG